MLAILTTHPIQYQVPLWQAWLRTGEFPLKSGISLIMGFDRAPTGVRPDVLLGHRYSVRLSAPVSLYRRRFHAGCVLEMPLGRAFA